VSNLFVKHLFKMLVYKSKLRFFKYVCLDLEHNLRFSFLGS